MPNFMFCPKCESVNIDQWPEEGFEYCMDCGWREDQEEGAAEQRNEAISDGQPCPLCFGRGEAEGLGEFLVKCPACNGGEG